MSRWSFEKALKQFMSTHEDCGLREESQATDDGESVSGRKLFCIFLIDGRTSRKKRLKRCSEIYDDLRGLRVQPRLIPPGNPEGTIGFPGTAQFLGFGHRCWLCEVIIVPHRNTVKQVVRAWTQES